MEASQQTQRRKARRDPGGRRVVRVEVRDGMGHAKWITADLVNYSESGAAVSVARMLEAGALVTFRGRTGENADEVRHRARVAWCCEDGGAFRAGLEFIDESSNFAHHQDAARATSLDCYEVMQLSPNADADTIHRVYRILAQRFHPDNSSSGDSETFLQLNEAYRILSDPEKRAGYDAAYRQEQHLQWNIFDKPKASTGVDGEKRKRAGILDLLYNKLLHDPEAAGMTIHEFESRLGCPREHLMGAIWYLKGKGYILRADNGRYAITVEGVDQAEANGVPLVPEKRLLAEPAEQGGKRF